MQVSIAFLVRVQCRRKESSRSLSHLLMSFLFISRRRGSVSAHCKSAPLAIRLCKERQRQTAIKMLRQANCEHTIVTED